MDRILIVDDDPPRAAGLAEQLQEAIERITDGRVGADLLQKVILEEAAPKIETWLKEIKNNGYTAGGLLLDYCDHVEPHAGIKLIDDIMANNNLKTIPVVFYTGKYVQVPISDLVSRGARGVIIREVGMRNKDIAKKALDYFCIYY